MSARKKAVRSVNLDVTRSWDLCEDFFDEVMKARAIVADGVNLRFNNFIRKAMPAKNPRRRTDVYCTRRASYVTDTSD